MIDAQASKIVIAKPSVQSLFVEMRFNGQPLATGTAFVSMTKKGPALITNRHNVTGRSQADGSPLSTTGGVPNELVVIHNRRNALGQWIKKQEPLFNGEAKRWQEHPRLGQRADFVALPLTDLDDVEIYPYDPSNPGADILVGPSDIVSVVGFPFGLRAGGSLAVWATGFMASEPDIDLDGLPIFLVDCRTRAGQSGSAVIAYRAGGAVATKDRSTAVFSGPVERFLGVYSGRVNSESDLGIVWRADAIAELIGSMI